MKRKVQPNKQGVITPAKLAETHFIAQFKMVVQTMSHIAPFEDCVAAMSTIWPGHLRMSDLKQIFIDNQSKTCVNE